MPISAKDTLFQYGDAATPEIFLNIGSILSLSGPSISHELIDITDLDDAAVARIASKVVDAGEVSIEILFDPNLALHLALIALVKAGTVGNYAICWPNVTANSIAVTVVDVGDDELDFGAAHGLYRGQPVQVGTDDTLPDPIVANTTYYAQPIDADSIALLPTTGGGAINILDAGVGNHTVYYGTCFSFAGYISGVAPSGSVKDKLAATLTFTIDGSITINS